ncbi:MAG: hypothetical protein K2K59_03400 [Muribaculaceae bacterium]|nr:hypothetical protein [Muribaculaceae bacterium]
MKRLALILGMAAAVMPASAKWGSDITFVDHEGYTNLSMYDCWEESPFRTGKLTLTPRIVDNPDTEVDEILQFAPNDSPKVVGAQRSRYGSNRFGVRVDLSDEDQFELTPTVRYVHVKLLKPVEGRVMLVGLGSRDDSTDPDQYIEQFWEVSQNSCTPGKWTDMVFAVKGAGGITMRSLVLVPDLESPHIMSSDFIFYIDDIRVNNISTPEFKYDYYSTNFDKLNGQMTRSDRYTRAIKLTSPKFGAQAVPVNQDTDHKGYYDKTTLYPLTVEVGETVTPVIDYNGNWMNAYCYIDFDNNGRFDIEEQENGTYGGEIVTYSNYQGKNSAGQSVGNGNNRNLPTFKIPEDVTPGLYRMRYKMDWSEVDPAGNNSDGNTIMGNGGVIVDVMLHIVGHNATATVNDFQLNGEVLAANGDKLSSYEIPAFEDFKVLISPENGFENNGFTFKVGYGTIDTEGEANRYDKYGNPNWFLLDFPLSQFSRDDDTMVIPGRYIFGNILIQGRMAQVGTRPEYYSVNFSKDREITRTDRHLNSFTFTPDGGQSQQISLADNTNPCMVYVEKFDKDIEVYAGKTVSTVIDYTGRSMHAYLYIDYNNNGFFAPTLDVSGIPTADSELVSFSCYQQKNSLGKSVAQGNAPTAVPVFTIPADLQSGKYRARMKIDWDNIDPGARTEQENNKIWENGGHVVDFYFDVKNPDDPEVGIEEINSDSETEIYDLQGRRVNEPVRGNIMIINGKTTRI